MSTATAAVTDTTGALSTEKVTYRKYVQFGTDPATGKSVITKESILAETDAKDKDTGLSANWARAEKDGMTLFSENEVTTYQVKSMEGFASLVPDPAQQLYLIQVGLDSIQTARANALMKSLKENTVEPEPEFNQATIDLRVGTDDEGSYSINKAPSRKSSTPLEKLQALLAKLNLTPEQQSDMLLALAESTPVEK